MLKFTFKWEIIFDLAFFQFHINENIYKTIEWPYFYCQNLQYYWQHYWLPILLINLIWTEEGHFTLFSFSLTNEHGTPWLPHLFGCKPCSKGLQYRFLLCPAFLKLPVPRKLYLLCRQALRTASNQHRRKQ